MEIQALGFEFRLRLVWGNSLVHKALHPVAPRRVIILCSNLFLANLPGVDCAQPLSVSSLLPTEGDPGLKSGAALVPWWYSGPHKRQDLLLLGCLHF